MKKLLSMLLVLCMLISCAAFAETADTEDSKTLVVGYSYFSNKFSPFFSKTAYDQDVYVMTQISLLGTDREGNVVLKGIEGETIPYNGNDHTYYGIADCDIVQNDDGTVVYNITMRDDVKFSDGEPMTIDDVIFSMYVFLDPTYDGSSTLYASPIQGLAEYRSNMSPLADVINAAGEDNTDYTYFTADQQAKYWDVYNNQAGPAFAQEIVDYCVANYGSYLESFGNNEVALGMGMWGFGEMDDDGNFVSSDGVSYDLKDNCPTAEDYWTAIVNAYDGDIATATETETAGSTLEQLTSNILGADYQVGVATGESAPNISGIQKTGDYSMTVTLTEFDATSIYDYTFSVAPMHYYGDKALYDYDNNMFGFNKGDLSIVKEKTTQPMGAGPFKFVSYENGVVTFEKNEGYLFGCPKLDYVLFKEGADGDKLTGVATGAFDISDPSFNATTVANVKNYNGNDSLNGDVITTITVDNLGYGYLGICANNVKVGEDKASQESKDLRKAFMTLFSVYRDAVIDSYYGEIAQIINYPISNTSWAAPRVSDEGYAIAYSKDVNGEPIYTAEMSEAEKYDAALAASIEYFKAAGYTWDETEGKFTAAPEGANMSYEVIIPADGVGDHPAYGILTAAKDALASIGITLEINDPSDSNILWDKLDAGTADMWTAAWQATPDPDMYQVYHSSNMIGLPNSSNSNNYAIADENLDAMIMEARTSADRTFRKAIYKDCLDTILDWAVELPTYQRQNAFIFSTERVNMDTITPDITTFWDWKNDLEKVEMK